MIAVATGPRQEGLARRVVATVRARSDGRGVQWDADGWEAYPAAVRTVYREREPARPDGTRPRGRPRLVPVPGTALGQVVKHRARGRVVAVERRWVLGAPPDERAHPTTVHVERLNGTIRQQVGKVTRKSLAFAKSDADFDAHLHLWVGQYLLCRGHPAHGRPGRDGRRRRSAITPAMALGASDHRWSLEELLTRWVPCLAHEWRQQRSIR